MAGRQRLDRELVRRKLARSRESAQELIASGAVTVNGMRADKSARQVSESDSVVIAGESANRWVSRGAHKLVGALDAFADVHVEGRICLDAGASTGGFTQVLLERGAETVYAVDVGYGQLAWQLRQDARVAVRDRTNIRSLHEESIPDKPELVVADLSFISLTTVLPALVSVAAPTANLVLMVKPQFEVGRAKIGKGGVVRRQEDRIDAVLAVLEAAQALGWGAQGVAASPLPGPSGNVEYFVWLQQKRATIGHDAVETMVLESSG